MHRPIHASAAMVPGTTHLRAVARLMDLFQDGGLTEPALGPLTVAELQLVPQSVDLIDEALCDVLRESYPNTAFRLHANVRVLPRQRFADLSNLALQRDWFERAAQVHRALGATGYSAHAGSRKDATMAMLFENTMRVSDLFGCSVAVEGHYPSADGRNRWLVSTWREYEMLFESRLAYALDLSHLNIVANSEGWVHWDLVKAMLGSARCLEVHVSSNDGSADQHSPCDTKCWWADVLDQHVHEDAVIFSEGRISMRSEAPGPVMASKIV